MQFFFSFERREDNYPIFGSDHSPILLGTNTLDNINAVGINNLKFEAMWLSHPDFSNVVRQVWNGDMPDNSSDKVGLYR